MSARSRRFQWEHVTSWIGQFFVRITSLFSQKTDPRPFRFRGLLFRRWFRVLFLASLIISLWLGHGMIANPVTATDPTSDQTAEQADQLVQQGVERYQQGDISGAIEPWQAALTRYQTDNNLTNQAIVSENLARAYQALGQASEAVRFWQQTIDLYRQLGNLTQMGRTITEQAQAYSRLGQHRQAIMLLCGAADRSDREGQRHRSSDRDVTSGSYGCVTGSAIDLAQQLSDPTGEIAALGSLGEAHRQIGEYDQAQRLLNAALTLSNRIPNSPYQAAILSSLGKTSISLAQVNYQRANSARKIGDVAGADRFRQAGLTHDLAALNHFQTSLTIAQTQKDWIGQVRSLIDAIPADYRTEQIAAAQAKLQQAITLLDRLPNSQPKAYAAIDLARLLRPISPERPFSQVDCWQPTVTVTAEQLLQQAEATAQQIGDRRSQSFALGELGHLYECQSGQTDRALDFTQQARQAAEQEPDSRYLWEWQTGRILRNQKLSTQAIPAYEAAISTLESIRGDILTAKRDIQFDFRDTIEPIYRQLIELRLAQGEPSVLIPARDPAQENLTATLNTLDSLKLAELQNYFGNDCALTVFNDRSVLLVGEDTATAVFSSVILPDRTAIVVSFPNGQQKFEWIAESADTLRTELNAYRQGLERFFDATYDPQPAQALYRKLIAPFATDLEQAQIKTLVFVQDGILRSVPMAALHDGDRFLIQRYAIATTPSLTLTDPTPLDRGNLRALAVGLSEVTTIDQQIFPALSNVPTEIAAVQRILPNSELLLNQEFTRDRFQEALNQDKFSIVHVATHGEFGTEPQDTFLVTGDSEKLTFNDLDRLLRSVDPDNPIQLLSLTACQTAVGDDRAALGLAGAAAQAGTRSVLASLWFIDDAATAQLVAQFYEGIQSNPNLSKAEALRLAQESLITAGGVTAHPAYWAPFVLIGNWL